MIASLLHYAWHRPECSYRKGDTLECSCGFREVLAYADSATTRFGELPQMRRFGSRDRNAGDEEPVSPAPKRVDSPVLRDVLGGSKRESRSK